MKIAYIHNLALPSRTAPSVHVMKMCQALSHTENEIFLIGPPRRDDNKIDLYGYYDVEDSFEIISVAKPEIKLLGHLQNLYLSLRVAESLDCDLIYMRNIVGSYLATLMGFNTVYECHNPVVFSSLGSLRDIIFKRLIQKKNLKALVVISQATRDYIIKNYDVDTKDIILARDCADPIGSDVIPLEFDEDKEMHVGYVGSLYKGRGKRIIKYLAETCDFAHFHIVGGKKENIKKWKDEFDPLNVTYHGFVPHSQLKRYMLGFDVLLAPYQRDVRTEGGKHNASRWMSPLKVFEYMATGKPIIASDLPAIREILSHEEDALLCDPDDPNGWKESIIRLYKDPALRDRLGNNALAKFLDNYTWDKRAERIMANLDDKL